MERGLYIHIPFCTRKCGYCGFYSEPMNSPGIHGFFMALEKELEGLPQGFSPVSIYMGGGTPTCLTPSDLERLLGLIQRHVVIKKGAEWTCEANPGSVTTEKAELLRDRGVNRISLGVQSFDQNNLDFLERRHDPDQSAWALDALNRMGFSNLSADLIYGIPGSSEEVLDQDLKQLIRSPVSHVSCYCLSVEENTPLKQQLERNIFQEEDEERVCEQYEQVRSSLSSNGFNHYEISNFAKPGSECRHNLLYWEGGEYLGCGPSAHSHYQNKRMGNVGTLEEYIGALENKTSHLAFEEELDPRRKACELLVFGLRKIQGVKRQWFKNKTGYDYMDLRGERIQNLIQGGFLLEDEKGLRMAEKAYFVSDAVFAELI